MSTGDFEVVEYRTNDRRLIKGGGRNMAGLVGREVETEDSILARVDRASFSRKALPPAISAIDGLAGKAVRGNPAKHHHDRLLVQADDARADGSSKTAKSTWERSLELARALGERGLC